jgi:hypothetical protein
MTTSRTKLKTAYRLYGECAKKVEASLVDHAQPSAIESERLIAFGIAIDWIRRASGLQSIDYTQKLLKNSARTPAVTELIRFNMAWSGMNALFSRRSVLDILGTTSPLHSELDRFQFLFSHSNVSLTVAAKQLSTLHEILNVHIMTRIPGLPLGETVTTLHALFHKYTPPEVQKMKTGKAIQEALDTGNLTSLDLPTLIYLMRNWSVHGGVIDSSFRSEKRFRSYIDIILESLTEIHLGTASALLARL